MLSFREILLNGVGFKCFYNKTEKFLLLQIGKSHYIKLNNSNNIIKTKKNKILLLSNNSAELGNFCAKLIFLKKPDSYKNIGVIFTNKTYFKKLGKRR